MCRDLVPLHLRENKNDPTVEELELLVIDTGCGFRPARRGGIRLEAEWAVNGKETRISVIYNYGRGGGGFKCS